MSETTNKRLYREARLFCKRCKKVTNQISWHDGTEVCKPCGRVRFVGRRADQCNH